MEILRTLAVSYLITTLGATGLAKLVNCRVVSVGMAREGVFPAKLSLPIISVLAAAELSLAVFLMLGILAKAIAILTGILFISFAAYRILVGVRVKAEVCGCSGSVRSDPATPAAVAGAVLACSLLAALSCALPFLGRPAGYPLDLISVIAMALPMIGMAAGSRARRHELGVQIRYPTQYVAIGTEELRVDAWNGHR